MVGFRSEWIMLPAKEVQYASVSRRLRVPVASDYVSKRNATTDY